MQEGPWEKLGSTSLAETSLSNGPVAAQHSVWLFQPNTLIKAERQHGNT